MVTIEDIVAARGRLDGNVAYTPSPRSAGLSDVVGGRVFLKLENLQYTGSFKARGALNRMLALSDDEKRRGVICASAGNHAQGVAYHAARLGIRATIVMPLGTPLIKVSRTQGYGAEVVLHGENYDDAFEEASRIAAARSLVYVHAYDDDAVIAGQGTIGLELLEQVPDLDTVIVPIGGGGLIAGIGLAIKARKPDVRIIGVEAAVLPSMKRALREGRPVALPPARTIAEGIAVRQVGVRNVEACARVVDDIVTVEEEEIARAILFLLEREKTVAEGAGAAGVAAVLAGRVPLQGRTAAILVCGGNIDVSMLSRIIERGLVESGRLARLSVLVPDRPGALAEVLAEVARTRANVVEVHHERAFAAGPQAQIPIGQVAVDLVVEARGHEHIRELMDALRARGAIPFDGLKRPS